MFQFSPLARSVVTTVVWSVPTLIEDHLDINLIEAVIDQPRGKRVAFD
jgi:hypothetical protein